MEFQEINSFLTTTLEQLELQWNIKTLSTIANQRVPDFITSGRGTLLRADIHILWTKWFLESICDPEKFVSANQNYFHILNAVKKRVPIIFPSITKQEQKQITRYIAELIDKEVQRKQPRSRISIDRETKKFLLDLYDQEPRCWICGHEFSQLAKEKFLNASNDQDISLPLFIDYITLHGLKDRHTFIEVDHVIPFSRGGQDDIDNYRLSCGWCNSHKSDRISIYDVPFKLKTIKHPKLGRQSIPHPFWIVRLLSVRQQCEHESGCDKTVGNSQLTVVYKHPDGAMNLTNLKVVCPEHDFLGSDRLISRTIAEKLRE